MSVSTVVDVTDAANSVARREARGIEARIEAAQTASIAMGAVEIAHVGKRCLIALATENPAKVLTATQVLILIGDDGESWSEEQFAALHASCNEAILSASDGTVDALDSVKAPSFRIPVRDMVDTLRTLKGEEKVAFLLAAQSTPVRESARAKEGGGASPDSRQHELLALQVKSAATKLKERLASTKVYLSQQDAAYRHHLVIPSDACVALFPEWVGGTIPKFPSLEEVNKVGTGLAVIEGRKSPLLNLETALLAAARAYAAPVPEELCSTYVDVAPLNSQEKGWSQLSCTVETVTAGLKGTTDVLRPVQLPARLVDEAIEVVLAVGSCLSKRQQKDFVLEVWGDWQRNMAISNLLAKSLRVSTELGGTQNGLSRASSLVFNDDCKDCVAWTSSKGKGKGSGGKAGGKSSKSGKEAGKGGGGKGKSTVKWADQQPSELRCDDRKAGGWCSNQACGDCYSVNRCVPHPRDRSLHWYCGVVNNPQWASFTHELLRTVCPDCVPSSHASAMRDEIYRRRGGSMSRVNSLLLERLLRTPPFATLACDATSPHAKLAGRLSHHPMLVHRQSP